MIIAVLKKLLPRVIEKVSSPKNGEIFVVEQFGQRKILVDNLTQSGPVMETIWKRILQILQISNATNKQINNILVLGLGGGSIVKVLEKNFPNAKIIAVDYDPVIVNLGKKYLGLKTQKNLKIIFNDATKFIKKIDENFDLIFVDLFLGQNVPKKCQTKIFLEKIGKKLTENGIVVFNRQYYKNHIFEAKIFLDKIKRIFNDVDSKKILSNLLIFARKGR